jgi:hypothetical protein
VITKKIDAQAVYDSLIEIRDLAGELTELLAAIQAEAFAERTAGQPGERKSGMQPGTGMSDDFTDPLPDDSGLNT